MKNLLCLNHAVFLLAPSLMCLMQYIDKYTLMFKNVYTPLHKNTLYLVR